MSVEEPVPTFFLGDSPFTMNELAHALECFVLEIRKKDGAEYTPNSLHHIVCGIMRHVRSTQPSVDFCEFQENAGWGDERHTAERNWYS